MSRPTQEEREAVAQDIKKGGVMAQEVAVEEMIGGGPILDEAAAERAEGGGVIAEAVKEFDQEQTDAQAD